MAPLALNINSLVIYIAVIEVYNSHTIATGGTTSANYILYSCYLVNASCVT